MPYIGDMSFEEVFDLLDRLNEVIDLAERYAIEGFDLEELRSQVSMLEDELDRRNAADEAAMNRAYERAVLS